MNDVATGLRVLTDNWLLQNVAELLERKYDPAQDAHWVDFIPDQGPVIRSVSLGALQVECLCTFVEQVLLCERIFLLDGYQQAWASENTHLDELYRRGVLRTVEAADQSTKHALKEELDAWFERPEIAREYCRCKELFLAGDGVFEGQVLVGTPPYLAISSARGIAYAPHPARARFLRQTSWNLKWPYRGIVKTEVLLQTSRLKLIRKIGGLTELNSIYARLPSIALYCLRCSRETPVLATAIQMREAPEFQALRSALGVIEAALHVSAGNIQEAVRAADALERSIADAERALGLPPAQDDRSIKEFHVTCGPIKLPVPVPSAFQRPVVAPRHSGLMRRMIEASGVDATEILQRSLGLRNPRVLRDLTTDWAA